MIFIRLLLFLLPILLFFFWLYIRKKARDEGQDPAKIDTRMAIILVSTIIVTIFSAWLLSRGGGAPRGQLYIAPKVVDGEIVPGRFVNPEDLTEEEKAEILKEERDNNSLEEPNL